MAVPNKDTRSQKGRKRRKRIRYDILLGILVGSIVSIFITARKTSHLAKLQDEASHPHHFDAPLKVVEPKQLEHENMLMSTMKECLPDKENRCKEFIPDGTTAQRIAILSPPGETSASLRSWVERAVQQARSKGKRSDYELIFTSHVPPYGYGKTHGLTKIIRLVPQPFIIGVTDSLQSSLIPGESQRDISIEDLKASLRQQIRYHCRISHVSAHTAMLTVPFNDILDLPGGVIEKIKSFLDHGSRNSVPDKEVEEMDIQEDDFVMDDDPNGLLTAVLSYSASMLTRIQAMSTDGDIYDILDAVLMEEFSSTKNLTAWPCQSFWNVGEPAEPLKLSALTQRIAKALSPDCSAPHTKCWVKRDLCETQGDGICKEK